MQLVETDSGWHLSGHFSSSDLMAIKKGLSAKVFHKYAELDISELGAINAPIIALMIEVRRHCESLLLTGCRSEFREMLKLYGLESIFQFSS